MNQGIISQIGRKLRYKLLTLTALTCVRDRCPCRRPRFRIAHSPKLEWHFHCIDSDHRILLRHYHKRNQKNIHGNYPDVQIPFSLPLQSVVLYLTLESSQILSHRQPLKFPFRQKPKKLPRSSLCNHTKFLVFLQFLFNRPYSDNPKEFSAGTRYTMYLLKPTAIVFAIFAAFGHTYP